MTMHRPLLDPLVNRQQSQVQQTRAQDQRLRRLTRASGALTSAVKSGLKAVARLIDNSAGTANSTLQALSDPANSPGTADALRDDLVANLIPQLRNNFADLAAKSNEQSDQIDEIIAVLRRAGVIK
jgi:hypothetical protein